MSALIAVLSITGALCLGAMSPGPSFVLVARTAVGASRRDGMATALGMGVGGVVFSGLALAGLYTVLAMVSWLYAVLKIGGGLYLVHLATQLSNPKTAIVYGSVFVSLLPQHPPAWCYIALPAIVFTIETGWYTVVALCFSSQRPRGVYLRAKAWIDRLSAGVIAALGLRLILTAGKAGL